MALCKLFLPTKSVLPAPIVPFHCKCCVAATIFFPPGEEKDTLDFYFPWGSYLSQFTDDIITVVKRAMMHKSALGAQCFTMFRSVLSSVIIGYLLLCHLHEFF